MVGFFTQRVEGGSTNLEAGLRAPSPREKAPVPPMTVPGGIRENDKARESNHKKSSFKNKFKLESPSTVLTVQDQPMSDTSGSPSWTTSVHIFLPDQMRGWNPDLRHHRSPVALHVLGA